MEQPAFHITYTHDKISVYAFTNYGKSKWNTPSANELSYQLTGLDTVSFLSGIENYSYNGRSGSAGINYRITHTQVFSFDYDYLHENDNIGNDMKGNNIHYFQSENTCRKSNTYTLYYKGLVGEKLSMYSDFSFNDYRDKYKNIYKDSIENIVSSNVEKRKAVDFSADLKWNLSEAATLKFGALVHDRKFNTVGDTFDYHRIQSRGWGYLQLNLSEKWSIETGLAFDHQHTDYSGVKQNKSNLLPSVQLEYAPTEAINVKLSYISDAIYPNMKQLSTIKSTLYPNVYHVGNPNLTHALKHKIAFQLNLLDMFSFIPSLEITKDAISSLVLKHDDSYEMTYRNAHNKELLLPLNADIPLGKRFFCSLGLGYYKSYGKYQNSSHNYDGLYYNADLMYNGKFLNLTASYFRNIQKRSLIQGYDEIGLDSWMLAINKQWFNKRFTTMVCWFLPLNFGIQSNMNKQIKTDSFYLYENKSLKPYR